MHDLLTTLAACASIFGLAFFYFWPAIPAGLALGLPPLLVIATTTLSYLCGAALVTLAGGRARAWILRRLGQRAVLNPDSLLGRAWARAGLVGLGLAAPMTVGAQMGAALGVALDAPPRRLLLWMGLGALGWSALLTALAMLGVLGAQGAR